MPANPGIPEVEDCGGDAMVLLVGNSKIMWSYFVQWYGAGNGACENPLDAYFDESLRKVLETCKETQYRIFRSHDCIPLKGGRGYVALQRMADVSGLAYLDHTSHLCLHPILGPWFSLRCAIVFDQVRCVCKQKPIRCPCPISENTRELLRVLFDEAQRASAQRSTAGGRLEADQPWKHWLAVRDAVSPNHAYRYTENQIRYHYTGQKQYIKNTDE